MNTFATEHKSRPEYLDVAANAHGEEKGRFVERALAGVGSMRPHIVEIGPGGGAAVDFLASRLRHREGGLREVDLTLIEVPGVASESLERAMRNFAKVGACELIRGYAADVGEVLSRPADVVSASALLHEVYSYGGGYAGLNSLIRALSSSIRPYGAFVYRDLFAVQDRLLHERVTHAYDAPSWLRFLRMFTPGYLAHGRHPYHRSHDQVVARQDSRPVEIADLDVRSCAVISAPIGLFREIQRHYVTFRDHVWRSGALGFRPILEGQLTGEWLDARTGHKLVHYTLTDAEWLPSWCKAMLSAVSEPYTDHFTVDGDVFDMCTDVALCAFLTAVEHGEPACTRIWKAWEEREGRETYAYLTTDELLTEFAVHSVEANPASPTALLPVRSEDVVSSPRRYYNRYLTKRLANPMWDAKQLVLFRNIPISDTQMLAEALTHVRESFSKHNLARVYAALSSGKG